MDPIDLFGNVETAWCPGCGNFRLLDTLKRTLAGMAIPPHRLCIVSGIGQAAKTPHYLHCNAFNGLHGRSLPVAQGVKIAHPELTVIAESGDGCHYGEGGNHFLAAIRRNVDITMVVHNNQIYGLTKGQASPTTDLGMETRAQPSGNLLSPFLPLSVAITLGAGFVARGFVGEPELLSETLEAAITHEGFALIDILQPCVSFNKTNTFKWYKDHVYIPEGHDPKDREAALALAGQWETGIPLGILYRSSRPSFSKLHPQAPKMPMFRHQKDMEALEGIQDRFR